MELITSPAKKYVNSEATFKVKLPAYETRRVEGTFLDEEGTKQDGKTLITYKGNTSQEGTPTPSSPIDVNVVTGHNEINVTGSNLIGLTTAQCKVLLHAGDKIVAKNTSPNGLQINLYTNYGDTTRNDYWSVGANATRVITIAYETRAISWNNNVTNGYAWINMGSTIQDIQEYEPYQSQSYEVNLGKNLFDKDNPTYTNYLAYTSDFTRFSTTASALRVYYLKCKPNTTYSISKSKGSYLRCGSCVNIPANNGLITSTISSSNNKATITTTENDKYIFFSILNSSELNTLTFDEVAETLQVEVGYRTPYAPYFEPIELCKKGTYQDKIYRQNNKWWLYKKLGKIVLNDTWGWTQTGTGSGHYSYQVTNKITAYQENDTALYFSNYYKAISTNDRYINNTFFINANSTIIVTNDAITSASDFKTWLASHSTEIYYVLATPTITEITNQALINQLEEIWESLKTYQEETIISQVNSDLPFYLDVLMEI